MAGLDTVLFVFAIVCAVVGVGLMIAMTSYVQSRGQHVNWLLLRLFVLRYVSQYRSITLKESGSSGPLFLPFVIVMNMALLFAVLGLVVRSTVGL